MNLKASSIRQRLLDAQDLSYLNFNASLLPTADKDHMIGVRIPAIWNIAKV